MKSIYVKKIDDKERFKTENRFYNLFLHNGFNVSKRRFISKYKNLIIYDYIFKNKEAPPLFCIVEILSKIYKKFKKSSRINKSFIEASYINSSLEVLQKYINLSAQELQLLEKSFYKDFYVGLFKDAKYENWLQSRNRNLVMIDFDYVKPSFFLADLAQLITTYCLQHQQKSFVKIYPKILLFFLSKIHEPHILCYKEKYSLYFLIASLYSNEKKKNYKYDQKKLDKQNFLIVNEIKGVMHDFDLRS